MDRTSHVSPSSKPPHIRQVFLQATWQHRVIVHCGGEGAGLGMGCPFSEVSCTAAFPGAHLKHPFNVRILALQQVPPGSQVAVGEDPTWLQEAMGMSLRGEKEEWHFGGGQC